MRKGRPNKSGERVKNEYGVEMRTRKQRDKEGKKIEIQLYDSTLKKEKTKIKYLFPFPHEDI
jgi:hypothetical protein